MTDRPLDRWLGIDHPDPGCEGAFEVLDQYVEALRRGVDAAARYPDFVTHIRNCAACREDTEGLLAALDASGDSCPGGKICAGAATNGTNTIPEGRPRPMQVPSELRRGDRGPSRDSH